MCCANHERMSDIIDSEVVALNGRIFANRLRLGDGVGLPLRVGIAELVPFPETLLCRLALGEPGAGRGFRRPFADRRQKIDRRLVQGMRIAQDDRAVGAARHLDLALHIVRLAERRLRHVHGRFPQEIRR